MVEARDRVGGRTYTVESDGESLPIDLVMLVLTCCVKTSVRDGRDLGNASHGVPLQGDDAVQDGSRSNAHPSSRLRQ